MWTHSRGHLCNTAADMGGGRIPYLTSRLQGFGTTIFTEMTGLAQAHGAVNLGQGFPDFEGPSQIRDAAIAAIMAGHNQYCRSFGILELSRAIAEHQVVGEGSKTHRRQLARVRFGVGEPR